MITGNPNAGGGLKGRHKQIHYWANFSLVGTINESDVSSSQLSETEQVRLLKSRFGCEISAKGPNKMHNV